MGNGAEELTEMDGRAPRGSPPISRWLRTIQPYLLLTPAAIFVVVVTVYPIAKLFWIATHATNYFRIGHFNGLANFAPLLSGSGLKSFTASAVFVICSDVLTVAVALALALVMEAPLRARGVLRTLVMVPWLVSLVVTALLWQALLDANFGPITALAKDVFGWTVAPLANDITAMASLIVANVWRSYPFAFILFLAAFQSIPTELYEAARIDGASRWQEFRYIALPMVGRTFSVILILLTFQFFTLVTLPLILTSGGPDDATYVLSMRIWREAFTDYHFGYSAATGVVVFLLNLCLSVFYIRNFVRREDKDVSK